MIAHQDWFMLDIPPPPSSVAGLSPTGGETFNELEQSPVLVARPTNDEWISELHDQRREDERDRKTAAGRLRPRRRANSTGERSSGPPTPRTPSPPPRLATPAPLGGLIEGNMGESAPTSPTSVTVSRSRTLPARPRGEGSSGSGIAEERHRNVLRKKGARTPAHPPNDDSG